MTVDKETTNVQFAKNKRQQMISLKGTSISHIFSQDSRIIVEESIERLKESEPMDHYKKIVFSGNNKAVVYMYLQQLRQHVQNLLQLKSDEIQT